MSLAVCKDCTARYAPSLESCPQCSSTERSQDAGMPLLPFLDLACQTLDCPVRDVVRRVYVRQVAPGVLEQPTLLCARCMGLLLTVRSWKDEPASADNQEENDMAKITVHGGPSNAADPGAPVDSADVPAAAAAEELSAEPAVGEPLPDAVDGDSTEREAPADYDTWTVEQLRAELAGRDLPTTGKKAELVARLTEADTPPAATE